MATIMKEQSRMGKRDQALNDIHRTAQKIDMIGTLLKDKDDLSGLDFMLEDLAHDLYSAHETLAGLSGEEA